MTESARAAEAAAINRTAAIQATVNSLLFETLGVFRQGETATDAEKMAAADDLLSRVVQAIEIHFDPGKANYALGRIQARRYVKDRELKAVPAELVADTETALQRVQRIQAGQAE